MLEDNAGEFLPRNFMRVREDEECYNMMAMTLYLQYDCCWNMCEPWLDVPAIS